MGVDNNAILLVGLPLNKELKKIILDKFDWEDDEWEEFEEGDFCIRNTSGYGEGELLLGIEIGDSGSYGLLEVKDFEEKIKKAREAFMKTFGKDPKLLLYNYQW